MPNSTAELITGLVQLVPLTNTTQLSQEAMEVRSILNLGDIFAAMYYIDWSSHLAHTKRKQIVFESCCLTMSLTFLPVHEYCYDYYLMFLPCSPLVCL